MRHSFICFSFHGYSFATVSIVVLPGGRSCWKLLWPTTSVHFETLVMKMLREMIEYHCKIKKELKSIQSEIKKNIWGTNSEGKEAGTEIDDLEQKEEINSQPEQNKEIRIQKYEERLRNLGQL